jgi:hypothetical protein
MPVLPDEYAGLFRARHHMVLGFASRTDPAGSRWDFPCAAHRDA